MLTVFCFIITLASVNFKTREEESIYDLPPVKLNFMVLLLVEKPVM